MKKEKFLWYATAVFLFSSFVSATLVDDVITRINDVICIFLCIIWYIIAALAALILILAGIKYISSESPDERDESRKRIIQALAGLIIVLIAMPLVNYLIQNTNIMAFRGCNCVFPPTNATTTTTPYGRTTTTPHGWITTTPGQITTTTEMETTTTTPSEGTTTTTTFGGIVTCNEECIIANYKKGVCRDSCIDDEIDHGSADDCPLPKKCCCVPFPSTTTTTVVTTTTTTITTTTVITTTTTTTTIPCANSLCPSPDMHCQSAESANRCYSQGDQEEVIGIDEVCGSGYRKCCCDYYNKCCGPAP